MKREIIQVLFDFLLNKRKSKVHTSMKMGIDKAKLLVIATINTMYYKYPEECFLSYYHIELVSIVICIKSQLTVIKKKLCMYEYFSPFRS